MRNFLKMIIWWRLLVTLLMLTIVGWTVIVGIRSITVGGDGLFWKSRYERAVEARKESILERDAIIVGLIKERNELRERYEAITQERDDLLEKRLSEYFKAKKR